MILYGSRGFRFVAEAPPSRSGAAAQRLGFARHVALAMCAVAFLASDMARAQDKGTLNPEPLPPLAKPAGPATPAKQLFGRKATAAELPTRSIGFYSKGCLAGAAALPVSGETWQVMRLSRNRNWGHPALVEFIEELSERAAQNGWPGLLIGDMSQPRGGPMLNGHASHQVGLDVDIWLTSMPRHELTRGQREEMMATMVVANDRKDVDRKVWTPAHVALIKAAAEDPRVNRIFVNTAIKKALCRDAGQDRAWLGKVQPWLGHDWHFHVRLNCPADNPECEPQPQRPAGDGCTGAEMHRWSSDVLPDNIPPRAGPKMSQLPAACWQVLNAPESSSQARGGRE
ncbi:MAG TPA: penicillin-insensitive murein endopeptidase [Xanthobacteraceae bacterium]|jgi:penicillin-insensitive murein endopeptidase